MWYDELFQDMELLADENKAIKMSAYMRDQFEFLGVSTPDRKNACKKYFKLAKENKSVDFDFVDKCYENKFREFQYIGINYLTLMMDYLTEDDIPKLKTYIETKSWWDTVDGLDKIVGHIALKYSDVSETLIKWSLDENIWLRRVAIDHQLSRKEKTNIELLERIILNNLNQKEFFINKAIGWSLREYSKTNPKWVKDFIEKYKGELSKLSIREASKYI